MEGNKPGAASGDRDTREHSPHLGCKGEEKGAVGSQDLPRDRAGWRRITGQMQTRHKPAAQEGVGE